MSIQSDYREARTALDRIAAIAEESGFTGRADDVRIAVGEALTNIIKHGYMENPSGVIKIDVIVEPGILGIVLSDVSQCALDMAQIYSPNRASIEVNDHFDLSESGRGVALIMAVCDQVAFRRSGGINSLSLTFKS